MVEDLEIAMGKPKQERTEQIKCIGQGIIIAEQAQNAIEQHNFDRLVRNGVIVDMDRQRIDCFASRGRVGEAYPGSGY